MLAVSGGMVATMALPAQAAEPQGTPAGSPSAVPSGAASPAAPAPAAAAAAATEQAAAGLSPRGLRSARVRARFLTVEYADATQPSAQLGTITPAGTATPALASVSSTVATPASTPASTPAPTAPVTAAVVVPTHATTTPAAPTRADSTPAVTTTAATAVTRTVEHVGARSQVVSTQALVKRLDRAVVRTRSATAAAALNQSYPVLTRAIVRTARNQTSTAAVGSVKGTAALSIASGLTGIWYRWGGSSPSGFDCSGYTSYVYRKMGIRLPRTAAAQQAYARRVSQPRPGDLVFFGSPAHHVGIYAGGGMMYDSPRSGRKTQLRKIYTSRVSYGRIA